MSTAALEEVVSLADMLSVDEAIPCEWNSHTSDKCNDTAEWRVTVQASYCPCSKITMLLCKAHEVVVRKGSNARELACLPHKSPVSWVRSDPF